MVTLLFKGLFILDFFLQAKSWGGMEMVGKRSISMEEWIWMWKWIHSHLLHRPHSPSSSLGIVCLPMDREFKVGS